MNRIVDRIVQYGSNEHTPDNSGYCDTLDGYRHSRVRGLYREVNESWSTKTAKG